jgi:pre-mRNA-splicing factor ATP-dependent RNA helicase DHX16
VRNQLLRLCERIDVELTSSNDVVTIKKAITAGYFFNVGKSDRNGESYHVAKNGGQQLYIHPGSSLFRVKPLPRYILYHELVLTSKEYARNVMQIEPAMALGSGAALLRTHRIREKGFAKGQRE